MPLLLELTLSGSVLALLLLGLRYLALPKMPSTVYYYAWLLVLLRLALPLPGLIPADGVTQAPAAPVYSETWNDGFEVHTPDDFPQSNRPAIRPAAADEEISPVEREETPDAPAAAPKTTTALNINWRAPALWFGVWSFGTVLSLGLTVLSYLRFTARLRRDLHAPNRFQRKIYAAIPGRKPKLYCSAAVRTPLMYGVLSPRVVLPERDCDEEMLLNILRHELTHYRRYDTLYKWVAVVILSAHWFNPLSWLIRRELDRACELSCDELLLRSMSRDEKQSYGNTLLSMAASSALPAGVVATTFATEKRNLKERLVQIMKYKKSGTRTLAAMLALVLLALCALAAGPAAKAAAAETSAAPAESGTVRVTNVDELLAAIAPNTVIELAEGEYDLSTASNYAEDTHSSYYSWNGVYSADGQTEAELVIQGVDGLTLRGAGMGETVIAAVPRYANVIHFINCRDLTVAELTAGHTREPGFCNGGVLDLEGCDAVTVDACGLYGCGTIGVQAQNCAGLTVKNADIYECSYGAVYVRQCRNVAVSGCDIHNHGTRDGQGEAMHLFSADYSEGFTVDHCSIHNNRVQDLLNISYTKNAVFLSNEVTSNNFATSVFTFQQYGATVDGCVFDYNGTVRNWVQSSGVYANDVTGKLLNSSDFAAMTKQDLDPKVAVTPMPVAAAADVRPGSSVSVTTVDELLSAIGPDRTIVLEGELFDLSTASNYGSVGGEYYFWNQSYDGPELVIQNVSGLTITAADTASGATTLAAIPRYANVLSFRNCENLFLGGFTAGHTKEPGSCSGGVLDFQGCSQVMVEKMRLYGCGILGIQTSNCATMSVLRTEIYECSQGAANFFQTDGIVFEDCDIHDVPSPALVFNDCGDKTWNGEPISGLGGVYDVDAAGALISTGRNEINEDIPRVGRIDELVNPFANEPTHTYHAGTPQAEFAAAVQQAFVDGDWESLADKICYPLPVFTPEYTYHMWTREEFMSSVGNENFMRNAFNDEYRARIGAADLSEFGDCAFGETTCGHLIAFSCFGDEVSEDNLFVTAISLSTPFYPGQAYAEAVPPTPQP